LVNIGDPPNGDPLNGDPLNGDPLTSGDFALFLLNSFFIRRR
jgi:hypothetical protein